MTAEQMLQLGKLKSLWSDLQAAYLVASLRQELDEWGPTSGRVCGALRLLNGEFHSGGERNTPEVQALYTVSLSILSIRTLMHEVVMEREDVEDAIFVQHEEIDALIAAIEAGNIDG